MKRAKPGALIAALVLLALFGGCVKEGRSTVTLNADGSFTVSEYLLLDRKQAEKQLRSMARRMGKKADKGSMSPEDIRDLIMEILERESGGEEGPAGSVLVTETEVAVSRGYTGISLEEYSSGHNSFRYLGFSHVKVDDAPGGKLRIELGREEEEEGSVPPAELLLAFRGIPKYALELILPGEITGSSFPETEGSLTRLPIAAASDDRSEKPENKGVKQVQARDLLVFECKKGRFSAPLPMDSRPLMRQAQEEQSYGYGLPLTMAGPGFVAEASRLQFKKTILLNEKAEENPFARDEGLSGSVAISGGLFPPEGRFILGTEKLVFTRAEDDLGRPVGIHSGGNWQRSHNPEPLPGLEFEVKLDLPDRRARAIERIDGEFVGVTASDFKDMRIRQPEKGELDASGILAKTTIVIADIKQDEDSAEFQLRIKGPEQIRYLLFSGFCGGEDSGYSQVEEGETRAAKDGFVRTLTLSVGCYGGSGTELAPGILVRMPVELKRERLAFRLEGMDLY